MKNVLSESIDKDEHQRMKSLHKNVGYRKRIVPVESTFNRIFKSGNINGYIRAQSKIMYQSGKFKKARTDHFNELMDNQSRYRVLFFCYHSILHSIFLFCFHIQMEV